MPLSLNLSCLAIQLTGGATFAGVRMKYWFSDEMSGENSMGGWQDQACGPFERHDSAMHFLRRWSVRSASAVNQ